MAKEIPAYFEPVEFHPLEKPQAQAIIKETANLFMIATPDLSNPQEIPASQLTVVEIKRLAGCSVRLILPLNYLAGIKIFNHAKKNELTIDYSENPTPVGKSTIVQSSFVEEHFEEKAQGGRGGYFNFAILSTLNGKVYPTTIPSPLKWTDIPASLTVGIACHFYPNKDPNMPAEVGFFTYAG